MFADKYALKDPTQEIYELPQYFWMRVAMGLCVAEKENPEERIVALYRLYKGRRFCSSTPTLFNSGTMHSQPSSCYLYNVDDSIDSIMILGIAENACLGNKLHHRLNIGILWNFRYDQRDNVSDLWRL